MKNIEKGVKHGARDYLLKPVRIEILRNIWQHVIRKTIYDMRPAEKIAADRRSTRDIVLYKRNKKREDLEAIQSHNEEPLVRRKTRAHWTPELHATFLAAVQQLREGGQCFPSRHILFYIHNYHCHCLKDFVRICIGRRDHLHYLIKPLISCAMIFSKLFTLRPLDWIIYFMLKC